MDIELVPFVLGALVGLVGLALLADAWLDEAAARPRVAERRRHARAARHRGGEAAVGLGMLAAAAALAWGDTWRFATVAVVAAAGLVVLGALLNVRYLGELLTHRGAMRRGRAGERRRVGAAAAPDEADRRPHDRRVADRRGAGRTK